MSESILLEQQLERRIEAHRLCEDSLRTADTLIEWQRKRLKTVLLIAENAPHLGAEYTEDQVQALHDAMRKIHSEVSSA